MIGKLRKVLFFTLFAVSQAASALEVSELAQHLLLEHALGGQFVQERFIEGFPKPVVSEGRFTVAPSKGLLWDTQRPFANRLIVLNDKLIAANEFESREISRNQTPQLAVFNRLAMALFSADLAFLQSQFQISVSGTLASWHMTLKPLKAPMNAIFQNIELKGAQYPEKIDLLSTQGELTRVTLSHQHKVTQLPAELDNVGP